jgi:3-hydroxyisobutyrate dehydrogenase-like beta-hydroxyacid dehydrogenase
MSECVGIVGVGLMGQAFSHHLLQAGFKVQGFDLDERRLALAEGLVLGMKAGMEGESLLEVLKDAACSSKTMVDKGPKMLKGEFSPEGHVRTSLKDARLALEQGARLGVPMHVGKLWVELQQEAYEQGLADLDSSAFIEVLRGRAGLPRRV